MDKEEDNDPGEEKEKPLDKVDTPGISVQTPGIESVEKYLLQSTNSFWQFMIKFCHSQCICSFIILGKYEVTICYQAQFYPSFLLGPPVQRTVAFDLSKNSEESDVKKVPQ